MDKSPFINLDLPKHLFELLSEAALANLEAEAPQDAAGRASDVRIAFIMRRPPESRHERSERLSLLQARLSDMLAASPLPRRVIVLECVDVAQFSVAPDYPILDFVMKSLTAEDAAIDCAAWAVRYRESRLDAFSRSVLTEFALTSLETAITGEEALEIFTRELEAHGVELDLSSFVNGDGDALKAIAAAVVETVGKLGLSPPIDDDFDQLLKSELN